MKKVKGQGGTKHVYSVRAAADKQLNITDADFR
jgi:hypothetical protein